MVRIVVAAPPKSGNHWIACLLGTIYELHWPTPGAQAAVNNPEQFSTFVAAGGFPDNSLFFHHAKFNPRVCSVIEAVPAKQVTIIRDPYDAFVSLYYWEQERSSRGLGQNRPRPRHVLANKPIDHDDVLAFLADSFGRHLARSIGWLESGRAIPIRYEELHSNPAAALTRVTDQIEPAYPAKIETAIEACRAERMRQLDEKMVWHVREARVGDSRKKLSGAHLAVFRERHAEQIRALGYDVR